MLRLFAAVRRRCIPSRTLAPRARLAIPHQSSLAIPSSGFAMVAAGSTSDAGSWTRITTGQTPYYVFTKPTEKSPQDDRDYRLIRLENGLQAMLVHHAKADKAAASLDVAVGHLYDPVSIACCIPIPYDASSQTACICYPYAVQGPESNYAPLQDDMPGLAHYCEHLLFMVRAIYV